MITAIRTRMATRRATADAARQYYDLADEAMQLTDHLEAAADPITHAMLSARMGECRTRMADLRPRAFPSQRGRHCLDPRSRHTR